MHIRIGARSHVFHILQSKFTLPTKSQQQQQYFHEIRYRMSGVECLPEAVFHKLDTYLFSVELCRRDTMDFSHCCSPIHQFEHPQRSRLKTNEPLLLQSALESYFVECFFRQAHLVTRFAPKRPKGYRMCCDRCPASNTPSFC